MRSRTDRRPDGSLARLARWLGFDRNPLRRGTDRVEAALRLVMVVLVVVAVPAAAVAAAGGPTTTPCTGLRSSGRSITRSPPSCWRMPRRPGS